MPNYANRITSTLVTVSSCKSGRTQLFDSSTSSYKNMVFDDWVKLSMTEINKNMSRIKPY